MYEEFDSESENKRYYLKRDKHGRERIKCIQAFDSKLISVT